MLIAYFNVDFDHASTTTAGMAKINYGYFSGTAVGTAAKPLCTIDNLISGYNEYITMDYPTLDNVGSDLIAKAAVDLFNIDRHTAATNMDAYVDCTANTKRNLSVDLLDNAVQAVMPYWKDNTMDNKVIVTGFDTVGRIQQLHYQFQRFMGYGNYQVTYNGVKTCPGDVVGFGASQFKGIPIIPDVMTTKNLDASGVSKIYVMDTNTIHHAVLIPPTFIQDKTYLARRALTDIATYYMASEMVCTKPRANAKIMNLQ